MRRGLVVAALTAALSAPVSAVVADTTVTVPGTSFPTSDTYLTYVGCVDLFHADDTLGPQARIGRPAGVPAGLRSLAVRVPGPGTAVGPVRRVESVAETAVAGFSARASQGTTGVAWVWYVAPGLQPGQVWVGRADLAAGPGWSYVDTRAATYAWALLDAAGGSVVEDAGPATIPDFTAAHGDGPGYLLGGLGCDGRSFELDAVRYGAPGAVTTYDLEGLAVTTTISASDTSVETGREVVLSGATVDPTGRPVGAALVLQARPQGAAEFEAVGEPVTADRDGRVRTSVVPEGTTEYRWFYPASGQADDSWSPVVEVVVPGGPAASR